MFRYDSPTTVTKPFFPLLDTDLAARYNTAFQTAPIMTGVWLPTPKRLQT